ncbi:MAG: hypothetical protein R3Y11_00440 [Pseudomonadota bacterium]
MSTSSIDSAFIPSLWAGFGAGTHSVVDDVAVFTGACVPECRDFWASYALFSPSSIDVGVVNFDYPYILTLHNPYASSKTLTFSKANWAAIDDSIPTTLTLAANETVKYTIAVEQDGDATINGVLSITVDGTTHTHTVTGTRGAYLQPFMQTLLEPPFCSGIASAVDDVAYHDIAIAQPVLHYENIILSVYLKNLQTIISATTYAFTVLNTYDKEVTYTISRTDYDGIVDSLGDTLTLEPFEQMTITVIVSLSGPFSINATLSLSYNGETASHIITGIRGSVIPFRPITGMTEVWEWKTEVFTNYDYSETYLALRPVPRMNVECSYHLYYGTDAVRLERMIYDMYSNSFLLPRFEMQSVAVATAGSASLDCDTAFGGWEIGSAGIAWKNSREYEVFEVADFDEYGITTANLFTADLGACIIMPCSTVYMQDNPTRSDTATDYATFTISYRLEDVPYWDIPDPETTLEGVEVCDMPLYVDASSLQRTYYVPAVILDNSLSTPITLHARDVATQQYQVTVPCNSLDEIMTMREFILRRQGCVRPFWASSRRHDIEVVSKVAKDTEYLEVAGGNTGVDSPVTKSPRSLLRIELVNGEVMYKYIRSITAYTTDTDMIQLNDYVYTEELEPDDFKRISFMSQFRLSADSVSWEWAHAEKASVTFTLQELYV